MNVAIGYNVVIVFHSKGTTNPIPSATLIDSGVDGWLRLHPQESSRSVITL